MKSVIEKTKRRGVNVYTVSNQVLGGEFSREFVLRKNHLRAVEYASWLEALAKKSQESQGRVA